MVPGPASTDLNTLFPGTGATAQLMRGLDWASTELGPVESWPQSLRSILPVMLASPYAMRVLWGPRFIMLYNDAYRPILGASKHPKAMAHRIADAFPETWEGVKDSLERVRQGEAMVLEHSPRIIDRNGYMEECYFNLTYSPMFDDSGAVAGVFGIIQETTHQVLAARRLETLRALQASAAPDSLEAACERAAEVLGQNRADIPFALFYLLEEDGLHMRLASRVGLEEFPAAAPERIEIDAEDAVWPLARTDAPGPSILNDVTQRFGGFEAGPHPEPVRSALLVPLRRAGTERSIGCLIAGISPRRALSGDYQGFIEQTAAHVVRVASDAIDRKEREKLAARERAADARLGLLFNEAPAAIAVLRGPELTYELANPLYCQLVGRESLVGHPGREVLPELVDQGIWDLFDGVYATGEPYIGREIPVRFARKGKGKGKGLDLGYFNLVVQPTRDLDGRVEGVMIFALEITELVLARHAAEEGRAERARLLASEQAARAEAERASHAKDEFLALVSHELRNPLSAMLGWTRLMRTGRLSPEKREHALETIERNAVNQSQLIEDLLDISRIIAGKLRLDVQQIGFVEIIRAALDAVRPAIAAKQLQVEEHLEVGALAMTGDAARLQQIVWNLLSNAVKFTPAGGRIQVVLKRDEVTVELAVIDSGTGIAKHFLPHVFDRFRQSDESSTRTQGGLGLGLSIAKNLVEMHGGTIVAESDGEGRGATFSVRLPAAARDVPAVSALPTAEPTDEPLSRLPTDLAGLNILVVDDEKDQRELVAGFLEQCGARVVRVGSAQAAIEALDATKPDVILSDIRMPGEDGLSLIRRIRSRPPAGGGGIPAASLTAFFGAEDKQRALLMGFNIHMQKPVQPDELLSVVASLGKIARSQT